MKCSVVASNKKPWRNAIFIIYGKIAGENKGLFMRHHSCLLDTTEAAAELPKAHSVGKKGLEKRKNYLVSEDFLQECHALCPDRNLKIFFSRKREDEKDSGKGVTRELAWEYKGLLLRRHIRALMQY